LIKKTTIALFALISSFVFGIFVVFGQDTERSSLIQYVEEQISSPNYQIRLNGLQGSLSSDVSLDSITISDEDGVWLEVIKPKLLWTRTALLVGRLEVNSLEAERINIIRKPSADKSLPNPESSTFSIPKLPVAVSLEKLNLPLVEFGKDIIDLASKASIFGSINIDDGSMDLNLDIQRLDEVGGALKAIANYNGAKKTLALDIDLNEPENGIVASAIGLVGKPPVRLTIKGDAPIEELDVVLEFDVDNARILDGSVILKQAANGLEATAKLFGPLANVLPIQHRDFFGAQSNLDAKILFRTRGGFDIKFANLDSGALQIAATAASTQDGFLSALTVRSELASKSGERVSLPSVNGGQSLSSAHFKVDYDGLKFDRWASTLNIDGISIEKNEIDNINLSASGRVLNLKNPDNRTVTLGMNSTLSGIKSQDPALADVIGSDLELKVDGHWQSGKPITLSLFDLTGNAFKILSAGELQNMVFNGEFDIISDSLEKFSRFTGQKLDGSLDLLAQGMINPISGEFDLLMDGETQSLTLGITELDRLMAGTTKLQGKIARSSDGLSFDGLTLANQQFDSATSGTIASTTANFKSTAKIFDLKSINDASSGQMVFDLTLSGTDEIFDLDADIIIPNGVLVSQRADNVQLSIDGQLSGTGFKGALSSAGFLASTPLKLDGDVSLVEEKTSIENLLLQIGKTKIDGAFERDTLTGLINAKANINSDDISAIAALGLKKASGKISGNVELRPDQNTQSAALNLDLNQILFETIQISKGSLNAVAHNVFDQIKLDANVNLTHIQASGIKANFVALDISNQGAKTNFKLTSALPNNQTKIATSGVVEQLNSLTEIIINKLQLTSNITNANLVRPTKIMLQDNRVQLGKLDLAVGRGNISASGLIDDQLNLNINAASLPIAIANSFQPGLDAQGLLNGRIQITGSTDNPKIQFTIDGQDINISPLKATGIAALNLAANGQFFQSTIKLTSAQLINTQGLALKGSGDIPLTGNGLNLTVNGTAPLTLAQFALRERGTRLDGTANISARVNGSITKPKASGTVNVNNAAITDPQSNVKLTNVSLDVGLNNAANANIKFNGQLSNGGSISANGSIDLTTSLPTNLDILLSSAKYGDGQTFVTTVDGKLRLSGNLIGTPSLSGDLNLGRTEITILENFATQSELLDIEHLSPSGKTSRTLDRLARVTPSNTSSEMSGDLSLNISVNAPNQIFVRGRGLDAELGGQVRLVGSLNNLQPQGRFILRRGRLSILGQRIDLDEGSIGLAGDLDPIIDFVASTISGDTQSFITLSGPSSDIDVSFSSIPELPQDEVLANIIFGRNLSDLSPLQIARLANVATELTGGSSPSLIDDLRKSTALDDIDLVEDKNGNAAIKAGKYINENVYLGVQASQETEATINLDITDSLTARGSVNSNNESTLGIFFEKDY
jgi:translocation and assembly module TamB